MRIDPFAKKKGDEYLAHEIRVLLDFGQLAPFDRDAGLRKVYRLASKRCQFQACGIASTELVCQRHVSVADSAQQVVLDQVDEVLLSVFSKMWGRAVRLCDTHLLGLLNRDRAGAPHGCGCRVVHRFVYVRVWYEEPFVP